MSRETFTFAIGDVHGCLSQLNALLAQIFSLYPETPKKFVFIGDYIDRGPDSCGVINRVMELSKQYETVALLGNHEDMFMDGNPYDINALRSFGITPSPYSLSDAYQSSVIQYYVKWMKERPIYHDDGKRFFVHAGVDSDNPPEKTNRSTMLWVRDPFLGSKFQWDRYIVHGHTPNFVGGVVQCKSNRINLDSACVFGGQLSCAVFNDSQVKEIEILTVSGLKQREGPL